MIVFAGVEWNIPPSNGNEHVTVLVAPELERQLTTFKQLFDDLDRSSRDRKPVAEALRWLAANATSTDGIKPVATYEHPSRKDARSMENVADMKEWRAVNDIIVGFAGAPGHQGNKPLGSYEVQREAHRSMGPGRRARWRRVGHGAGRRPGRLGGLRTLRLSYRKPREPRRLLAGPVFRDVGVCARTQFRRRLARAAGGQLLCAITDGSSERPNCRCARRDFPGRPARVRSSR